MKDKRHPEIRTTNPAAIQMRIMVANAFISFCWAQGLRDEPFSPYLHLKSNSYLDRDELRVQVHKPAALPEIEILGEFVRNQVLLRDRVATGLMIFGGLRVDDMLSMQISDVPRRLDTIKVGSYRVELMVFGKGRKWRTTTIPTWVYDDLQEFASTERNKLRKYLLARGLNLPVGKNAPVFVSINNTNRFGKRMSPKFVRKIFDRSVLGHPHSARHAFASWRMIELLAMQSDAIANSSVSALSEIGFHDDVKNTLALEMGHANIESTDVYLKWARSQMVNRNSLPSLLSRIQKVHHGG